MHSSCNDSVIQLSQFSNYAVLEFVEISHACFVHLVLQYSPTEFKSGEFGGYSRCRMNSGVSILAKTAFFNDVTITSSLRRVVQELMRHFYNFSVSRIVRMIHAKNYEKLSKFVEVTDTER